MEKKKFLTIRRIIVLIFILLFAIITYINFRGNYIEYEELGENYLKTFLTREKIRYSVIGTNFIFIFIIMYFSGIRIKKGLKEFFIKEEKEIPRLPNKSIALMFSAIESLIIEKIFTANIILLISNTSFGETDPIFHLDISFFMFIEPILKMMTIYIICILVGKLLYSYGYYVIVFHRFFDGIDREKLKTSILMKTIYKSIIFIAIFWAIYILICSMDIVFDNFLTTDNNIKLAGAGIVDSTLKYWGYNLLAIIILISMCKATISLREGKQSKALKDLIIIPLYFVILFIVMILFDFILVRPNKFDKEKKYIESNINLTKRAFAIDCDIQNIEYSGTINIEDIQNNDTIIENAVIVDKQIVLDNLNETQIGTGYYTYNTAKILRYDIDGNKKLVYAAPREIVSNKRTYNSKTYEYTHGYGMIFTSATHYTSDGKIDYIQNDITGKENKINILTPQIYYGLETNTTVVTNAKNKKEFDYSDGSNEYESNYQGNAGVTLNFVDRLIIGIKEKNINLALSSAITSDSKVLLNRNILKRARLALSDVIYDENPYAVVDNNGNIYWVIDAYTISSSYPYSTYTGIVVNGQRKNINYIRNSIKVIINSYNGEMKFYITDRTDPIAMAYRKVYPELFQDLDTSIDESIQEQFIYPEFLFNVQSKMLEEYHNTKADVLYRSDDTWEKIKYKNTQKGKNNNTMNAYYTMVKIEDKSQVGLIQMYSLKNKQTLNAYLIGITENGENKLYTKILRSDAIIIGPAQLDIQISQDETIQKEIDSLQVTGAKITKDMIMVPIEDTILYIEPIYQTLLNESKLPVLKKVIVASGNKLAIGDNLQQAVTNLISKSAVNIEIDSTDELDDLIDTIIKANNNLTDSLEKNNWELIGSDIKKIQELIKLLDKRVKNERKINNNIGNEENLSNTSNIIEENVLSIQEE